VKAVQGVQAKSGSSRAVEIETVGKESVRENNRDTTVWRKQKRLVEGKEGRCRKAVALVERVGARGKCGRIIAAVVAVPKHKVYKLAENRRHQYGCPMAAAPRKTCVIDIPSCVCKEQEQMGVV